MEFIMDRDIELTEDRLINFIRLHMQECFRYKRLKDMYEGKHEIFYIEDKPNNKPDNRLMANFAKYIVDTFEGFFMAIPVKTTHNDLEVSEYLEHLQGYNNQDDNNAELSKTCSIYGSAFELIFSDENSEVGITTLNPTQAFIIYDNSIRRKALYGVRYFTNDKGRVEGSYSDKDFIYYFKENDEGIEVYEIDEHYFGDVPLIEYVQNAERQGIFENVISLIDNYNKAISEKANDVDYFADAYMAILGAELGEEQVNNIRDNRIINLYGDLTDKLEVFFLDKPNADQTQENHINRLKEDIFTIAMVANITDENFGQASGVALAYKLQAMSNMAGTKERKFISGMNQRYKIISNYPNAKIGDKWTGIKYKFARNIPKNSLEESQMARNLFDIVSRETLLTSLSVVDNVDDELEKIKSEADEFSGLLDEYRNLEESSIEEDSVLNEQ